MDPLGAPQRRRLTDALATAERLIRSATCIVESVDVASDEAVAAVCRYFDELDRRFSGGFDAGEATTSDLEAMCPPSGDFLVLRSESGVVACGGLQRHTRTVGEIKRMWVDPEWRGCGLAVRLLHALEDRAAELGYREVYLDTNASLTEAIAMYERAGYRRIERYNDNPYAHHWFARRLSPRR